MRRDPKMLCEDVLQAIDEIQSFCQGKTFGGFQRDRALQLIIEREFEIIGEALTRLRRDHPALVGRITDADKIIGLRNVLAHGYDLLEYEILWDVVENKVPILKRDILSLS